MAGFGGSFPARGVWIEIRPAQSRISGRHVVPRKGSVD